MQIVAVVAPVADVGAFVEAARVADGAGLEGVGVWDHYHSLKPEWAYVAGWSALAAAAAVTQQVRLVPMVLNGLHYDLGVLAKESSILSLLSGGRYELGLGAGDWPGSFEAWGRPFPDAATRLTRLVETVRALRLLWAGGPVDLDGEHITLRGAISAPTPEVPPRVVIGVGGSRRTLEAALPIADELNVYPELVAETRARIADAARPVALSVHTSWEWDSWPAEPKAELDRLAATGIDRLAVAIGGDDMPARIERLARWSETA